MGKGESRVTRDSTYGGRGTENRQERGVEYLEEWSSGVGGIEEFREGRLAERERRTSTNDIERQRVDNLVVKG